MSERGNHDAGFKARRALEAVKGERTASEPAAAYGVRATMIHQWKKALFDGASDIFERGGKKTAAVDEEAMRDLHAKIGEPAVAGGTANAGSPYRAGEHGPQPFFPAIDGRSCPCRRRRRRCAAAAGAP